MLDLAWHFDFHSHPRVNIGRKPDPKGIANALSEAGVGEIISFAKGHDGYTYYPTKLKYCYRHPKMKGDPFGDIVHACTAKDVDVLAYISFGIDGEGARQNPYWRQVFKEGQIYHSDWFISVCPFTPYTDECVLPQIDEVIKKYPITGFFFDTIGALGTCYCDWCRKDFMEATGQAVPRDPDDKNWGIYGQFRHDRGIKLLDRVSAFIQKRLPGAAVGFNQVGSPPFPEKVPAGCTRLTLDFATYGHQSRQASRCAAYGSTAPIPADIMPTIFNSGWGDWTLAPRSRHEQIASAVWARQGKVYMGDRMHPDNRLAPPTVEALKIVKNLRTAMAPHYPAESSRLSPDMLLLHSTSMQYGTDMRSFALDARTKLIKFDGASDLLLDAGANYAITAEYSLPAWIDKVKLVILPELESISAETSKRLEKFARGGGQVLVVGRVPLVGNRAVSWTGVAQSAKPWQDHIYVPALDESKTPDPVLVRGDYYQTTPRAGTEVVQRAIQPLDMLHGVRMGWGIAPPSERPSRFAALTRRPVGSRGGAVWTLAAPLFSSFHNQLNWQQVLYMADLLALVVPRPGVRLSSPYGNVEGVAHVGAKSTWTVLVNHGGEHLSEHFRQPWPRTWGPVPAYEVTVEVRDGQGRRPARVTLNGQVTPHQWQESDGTVRVPVRMDEVWKIARVDWA